MTGPFSGPALRQSFARTRVSLEIAVHELADPVVITAQGSQIGRGEPPADTARVFRIVDVIAYRTFESARDHRAGARFERTCRQRVTDDSHPLQLLADLYTVKAVRGKLAGLRSAWIGDGNNMARSWIEAARLLGLELALAVLRVSILPKKRSRSPRVRARR